jgi:glycosyltransferase involved in cell wall biosynthesis
MNRTLYVDLRCLQDPNYRVRGIGHHVAALLRARPQSEFSNWKTVGLTDPRSPKLLHECSSLVDEVTSSVNPCCDDAPAVFIDGTPMTHDTRFSVRFLGHSAFLSAAVVYDFIPLDWPGYLPTVVSRTNYLAKMARLRNFDLFFPISEYTAWRTSELLGVSHKRIHITGASVRNSVYELRDRFKAVSCTYDGSDPYFVIVLASDARKNPEVVVKALRHLNLLYSRRVLLKVVGHYDDVYKHRLLILAGQTDNSGFLQFCPGISDEELVSLYAGATATIAPSHIEGFSLPIVEASVCGSPVIASTCAAQLELIEQPEALFQSDDANALSEKLEALLNRPSLRTALVASQAHLGAKFHEDAVGRRFWNAISAAVKERHGVEAPFVVRKLKPSLAFLSPFPPDRSGVARYTAMTMQAGENLFDSDLYTDAPRPLTAEGRFRDIGGVSVTPLLSGQYNGVISVIGNSPYHTRIFEVFERYGGPCILHDARLTKFYFHRFGADKFLRFAAEILGRPVSMDQVSAWLEDRDLPSLFLERIVERASPLIVHTVTQQALLKKRYGVEAHVTTCCPTQFFSSHELTIAAKQAARQRLGIRSGDFLVSSFGMVDRVKGTESCVLAVDILRSWNIPVELYLVGGAGPGKADIDRISSWYGITEYVHGYIDFVDDTIYRDFLIASDAAVQLRTYGFGQLSAALTDSISAGLPCVANSDLAKSCDAPEYVSTVPDQFSPLQIAEQLALIWERRSGEREHTADARHAYLKTHNFEYYGKRLIEVLGIA